MVDAINVSFTRLELVALRRALRDIVDDGNTLVATADEQRAGVLAALKVQRAYGKLVNAVAWELTLGREACAVLFDAVFPPAAKPDVKKPARSKARSRRKAPRAKPPRAAQPSAGPLSDVERVDDEHERTVQTAFDGVEV